MQQTPFTAMWSRTLTSIVFLSLFVNASIVLRADVQFSEQPLKSVQSSAKSSQTPYLVYVFDANDRQCRKMARKTWKNEALAQFIQQNYLTCKLDVFAPETDIEWVQDYGIYEYPSVLFFSADGILLGKADGFLAAETMLAMLKKHLREIRQKEEVRLWAAHYEETQYDHQEAMYLADNTLSADAGEDVGHLFDLQTNLADLQTDFPAELPDTEPILAMNEPMPQMRTRGMAPAIQTETKAVASEARSNSHIILDVPGLEKYSLNQYGHSRGNEEVPMNYALLVGSYTSFPALQAQLERFSRYWQDDVWVYCEEVNKTPVYKLLVGPYIDQESAEVFAQAMYKFQKINPTVLNIEHLKQ